MSRSRYYPGYRYDRGDRDEWYAWKRRREDIATGMVRTRIYRKRMGKSLAQILHERRVASENWPITETPEVPVPTMVYDLSDGELERIRHEVRKFLDRTPEDQGCPFER